MNIWIPKFSQNFVIFTHWNNINSVLNALILSLTNPITALATYLSLLISHAHEPAASVAILRIAVCQWGGRGLHTGEKSGRMRDGQWHRKYGLSY